MKTYKYIIKIVIMCAGFVFSCTKEPLPDHYGVFLVDNKKLIQLKTVKTCRKCEDTYSPIPLSGDLSSYDYIVGIEYASEIKSSNPKMYFLAYSKEKPEYKLYKLAYHHYPIKMGEGFLGDYYYCLWSPVEEIGLNITPIKGKSDMYRLTLVEPLMPGQYAICLGDFRYGQVWNFGVDEVIKSK